MFGIFDLGGGSPEVCPSCWVFTWANLAYPPCSLRCRKKPRVINGNVPAPRLAGQPEAVRPQPIRPRPVRERVVLEEHPKAWIPQIAESRKVQIPQIAESRKVQVDFQQKRKVANLPLHLGLPSLSPYFPLCAIRCQHVSLLDFLLGLLLFAADAFLSGFSFSLVCRCRFVSKLVSLRWPAEFRHFCKRCYLESMPL